MPQISYIKFKDITEARRYDAECFSLLDFLKKRFDLNNNFVFLNDDNYFKIIDGDRGKNYPNGDDFSDKDYCLFLNTSNVLKTGFDFSNNQYISKDKDNILSNGKLIRGDIVFTTRGTIGNIGVFNDFVSEDNIRINSGMVIFRIKNININYFFVCLLTDYVTFQIKSYSSGSVQSQIPINTLKNIKIPLLKNDFQIKISDIVFESNKKQDESKKLYKEAGELLLSELGLLNFKPKNALTFTATKKETEEAQRFDSEYFEPKYDEIIERVEKYSGGWDFVKNQFNQNTSLIKKNKVFYNYIEIGDVNTSNGEVSCNKMAVEELPANGKRKLNFGDLLISKVRPYRGAISFIDFEVNDIVGSGAFTVLQEKTNYKKEVLMIFLKTHFIKDLLLRYNCGTSYPVIKDEDILNLKIPLIKQSIQNKIAEKIGESHKLRKESKELLEKAKKMVEEEIEK